MYSFLNQEAAFLLAFRALAYEYLAKKNSLNAIKIQREIDKGKNFEKQIAIQSFLHAYQVGLLRGMRDLEDWKSKYDMRFVNRDYATMPHYVVKFKRILPFVCCGCFHPEVDFSGNKLQIISRSNMEFEHVCSNVSVIGDKSFLAFGWHGISGGPAEQFVKSFKNIKDEYKANAALILAVEQLENTYFKPSWWDGLSDTNRNHLISRMRSGIGFNSIRPESTYQNIKIILPSEQVENEIGSI